MSMIEYILYCHDNDEYEIFLLSHFTQKKVVTTNDYCTAKDYIERMSHQMVSNDKNTNKGNGHRSSDH